MHNKGNYKQGEKTALRLGENILGDELSDWNGIKMKDIQTAH